MRHAVARLLAVLLTATLVAGCFSPGGTTEPPKNINPGDGNGGSTQPPLLPGKHLNVTLESTALSEGASAKLLFANPGDVALDGSLVVDLVDPAGIVIARTTQPGVKLEPRGKVTFTWPLPAKLEPGAYSWNATLDGASAVASAPVAGTAEVGEGPPPLGFTPVYHLEVLTDKSTYERDQPVVVTLANKGNVPARGALTVTIHGPAATTPTGSTHTAPEVARFATTSALVPAGGNVTLAPLTIPLGAIPVGLPQYYVFVAWAHGTAITNLFVDNRSEKPAPTPGALAKTFEAGPTFNWEGNDTITVVGANGKAFQIFLHYATSVDQQQGEAPSAIVPSPEYRTTVKNAFTTAWNYYKAEGWLLPQMPIHAYIDNPGGSALGTFQPTAYGGHIVIGPETLHTGKSDPRTTVAHELFHAFQTRYDYDEGMLVEGYATWIMDKPFGTKDYLGQARAYINNPDNKPIDYQEHEFVLFMRWLDEDATYGPKLKQLTENSANYDNEALFAKTFGKSFDALWTEFMNDFAARNFADRAELFEKTGVFGLKAWQLFYTGAATNTTKEKADRTLKLPVSNFELEMIDEDVGQVKHAYGIDVFSIEPAGASSPTSDADDITVSFTSRNAETSFTVLVATRAKGTTDPWTVTPIGAGKTIANMKQVDILVFITRGAGGTGHYDLVVSPA